MHRISAHRVPQRVGLICSECVISYQHEEASAMLKMLTVGASLQTSVALSKVPTACLLCRYFPQFSLAFHRSVMTRLFESPRLSVRSVVWSPSKILVGLSFSLSSAVKPSRSRSLRCPRSKMFTVMSVSSAVFRPVSILCSVSQ